MDRGGYISYVAKGEEEEVGVDSVPLEHLSTVQWIQVCFVTRVVHSSVDSGLLCDLLLSTVQWIQVCFVT